MDIKGIQGATGHVGVDTVMGDCATGQCYSPGNNHTDPFYGGASIWADEFSRLANGGVYSRDLGIVPLPDGSNLNPDPTTGEYAVAKLNGYVFTHAGDMPKPGRATLHLWGNTSRVTTIGVEIQGFASTSNIEGGYYSSGWLYPGKYLCMLIDNGTEPKKVKLFEIELLRPFERLDFTLETIFDS